MDRNECIPISRLMNIAYQEIGWKTDLDQMIYEEFKSELTELEPNTPFPEVMEMLRNKRSKSSIE
jgi:hypothetical protein